MPVEFDDPGIPMDRVAEISGEFVCGAGKERHAAYLEAMIARFTETLRHTFEENHDKELPLHLTLGFRFERAPPRRRR